MNKRIKKMISATTILFVAGVLYYVIFALTGFAVPCVFHSITGLYCPGCGISRMFVCIFELDFISAMHQNLALFFLSPILLIMFITSVVTYIKTGNMPHNKWFNTTTIVLICCFVLFGVLRNIPYFSFLAPID